MLKLSFKVVVPEELTATITVKEVAQSGKAFKKATGGQVAILRVDMQEPVTTIHKAPPKTHVRKKNMDKKAEHYELNVVHGVLDMSGDDLNNIPNDEACQQSIKKGIAQAVGSGISHADIELKHFEVKNDGGKLGVAYEIIVPKESDGLVTPQVVENSKGKLTDAINRVPEELVDGLIDFAATLLPRKDGEEQI